MVGSAIPPKSDLRERGAALFRTFVYAFVSAIVRTAYLWSASLCLSHVLGTPVLAIKQAAFLYAALSLTIDVVMGLIRLASRSNVL